MTPPERDLITRLEREWPRGNRENTGYLRTLAGRFGLVGLLLIAATLPRLDAGESTDISTELEQLKQMKRELFLQIQDLDTRIALLETELAAGEAVEVSEPLSVVLLKAIPLVAAPGSDAPQILNIPAGSTVTLLVPVEGDWWAAQYGGSRGYVEIPAVSSPVDGATDLKLYDYRVAKIREARAAKEAEEEAAREEERRASAERAERERTEREKRAARERAERERSLTKKYGRELAERIVARGVWLGMTREMLLDSLGYPDDVNRTVTRLGVTEQWVYGSRLFYFENGILEAWQD